MMRRRCTMAALLALLLGAGVTGTDASPRATGVTIALLPANQQVNPGAVFDLYVQATQAGDPFNGFDAVIGYDPAALTLVPMNPVDLQQGSYMLGACGSTFHVFKPHAGIDTVTDVLLCDGVSLPGPGQLYHLRFQASSTPQVTGVHFLAGLQFYNAGVFVKPVYSTDALVGIGMPAGVGPAGPVRLGLTAAPNPGPGRLVFTIESDRAGPESLTVFDLQGRAVRRFAEDRATPGRHTVAWDGRSDAGTALAPGVYLARLLIAGQAVWNRVTLIR